MKVIIEVELSDDLQTVLATSHTEDGEYDPDDPVCKVADKIMSLWDDHVNKLMNAFGYGRS